MRALEQLVDHEHVLRRCLQRLHDLAEVVRLLAPQVHEEAHGEAPEHRLPPAGGDETLRQPFMLGIHSIVPLLLHSLIRMRHNYLHYAVAPHQSISKPFSSSLAIVSAPTTS